MRGRCVWIVAAGVVALWPGPLVSVAAQAPAPPAESAARAEGASPAATLPRVQFGLQYRGRVEGTRGLGIVAGRDDEYYLNRVRLDVTMHAARWLRVVAQAQDATVVAYSGGPAPGALSNRLDLRQGYIEAGHAGVLVRAGRQELSFGEQRLIGGFDWGNTARSFDALRVSYQRPGVRADAFAASVVVVDPERLDRRRRDERLWGAYVSFDRVLSGGVFEPYVFVKQTDRAVSEAGVAGHGEVTTGGLRVAGTLPHGFDYSGDIAWQRGALATDAVSAMAVHARLGWRPPGWALRPRFVIEGNHASGDERPGDGRRGTFDQLYPTNHAKYGIADAIGWRNMRSLTAGVELTPARRVRVHADVHRLHLATRADGLYLAGGARRLHHPDARSTHVGTELDLQVTVAATARLAVMAGVARLAAGAYLAEAARDGVLWTPHVMWTVKF